MVDPATGDATLDLIEELRNNCTIRAIQVDCTKLYDGTVHRHYLQVAQLEELSVQFFRDLIETHLDIPAVCQVRLTVNGISLDPLPLDFCDFPNRFIQNGDPIRIRLEYYVASADMVQLAVALDTFCSGVSPVMDYKLVSDGLDHLETSCFNVKWDSNEAVGYRLYMNSIGFLPILFELIEKLNASLKDIFERAKDTPETYDDDDDPEWMDDLIRVFQTLLKAIRTLMLFSARWEDKMLMCELKFPSLIRDTLSIAQLYFTLKDKTLRQIGDSVVYYCSMELQLLLSVRAVSVQFGLDRKFLEILKDCLILKRGMSSEQRPDAICLFNLSGAASVSQLLYSSGIYEEIINFYQSQKLYTADHSLKYEVFYRVALVTMHMLKTPNLHMTSPKVVRNSSTLLNYFLSKVTAEDIANIERDGICFGTLENYFSILFIPSNSILGKIMAGSESRDKYRSLISNCFKMGVFTMEVLMLLEAGRRVILSENLLPHMVIANWTIGNLTNKIKLHFPSITHLPVPSLYDIAALKAVSIGIGDYKEMMHYKI